MVKAPTPEEEDRRRLCRERKVLIGERVQHVNRVKGLLFSQGISGYEPLRRDRREQLDTLQTGDGRLLPDHLKAQVCRELDRLELLLEQIKAVEAERDVLLAAQQVAAPAPAAMLLDIKGIGPEFAAILWSEGLFRHFDNRRQVASYAGLAPTPALDTEQRPEFHLCATESHPLTWTSPCEDWSLTTLKEKLIKIGAKVVICGRPSMASTFLALRTIWLAAVICPASVGAEHMSAGPDEVRRPGSLSATRAFR